jgi:Asp/Glu/hydantoin racemase
MSSVSGNGGSADGAPATLAFVHTVLSLPPTFAALAEELVPGVETFHVVDESLLTVTRKIGSLTETTRRRVLGYLLSAADAGADLILVTCSSIGPAVDASRSFVRVPVVRVDEPMADEAVRLGTSIGVLATLRTTLEPTADLVRRRAGVAGKPVEVVSHVCDGAFEALQAGDRDRHDELVAAGVRHLAADVDVIVLAQASMARVVDALPEDQRPVPVLSSPRLGMQRVAELLRTSSGAAPARPA